MCPTCTDCTLTGLLISSVTHCTSWISSVTHCTSCRDAAQIPWGDAGADVICESTGVYTTIDKVINSYLEIPGHAVLTMTGPHVMASMQSQ